MSLDLLINDLKWRSSQDHIRAKFELETIALNHIEYFRSDEKLLKKLTHFFRVEWLGVLDEFDCTSYVEQSFMAISLCRLLYISDRPESVLTYEFTPPED